MWDREIGAGLKVRIELHSVSRSEVDERTRPKYNKLPTSRREKARRSAYSADKQGICPSVQVRCSLLACQRAD